MEGVTPALRAEVDSGNILRQDTPRVYENRWLGDSVPCICLGHKALRPYRRVDSTRYGAFGLRTVLCEVPVYLSI